MLLPNDGNVVLEFEFGAISVESTLPRRRKLAILHCASTSTRRAARMSA
jgi:hypothetical protein